MINKKICILTSVHSPFDSRIFYKEARSLAMAGYDVSIIAEHNKSEIMDEVKIIALPKTKNRLRRLLRLPLRVLCLSLKQKADVYHFHDPELISVGVILKLLGKKVIYDVHEDYSRQILSKSYLPKITRNAIAYLIKTIEYILSNIFDGIITATDDILKNFSHHKKAISIKNFPALSTYLYVKKLNDNDRDIFNLIYIGGLTEIRGITQIIKALEFIESNRKIKLNLCGKFYPTDYEKEVRGLNGFEKVEYLGWIDHSNIPKLIKRFSAGIVCLHPISNYLTSLPLKLFEYMAASLPVIASNFPLWKEIVEGNKCGICVDPLKPEDIAKAITYLIEHPEVSRKMGENGRKAILDKYNWEKESEKLVSLYEELLKDD